MIVDSLRCRPEPHVNCRNENFKARNHLKIEAKYYILHQARSSANQGRHKQRTNRPFPEGNGWDTPRVSEQNLPTLRKVTLFPPSGHTALKTDGVFYSKRRKISIRLHGVTRQKTVFVSVTAARTSLVAFPVGLLVCVWVAMICYS